MKKKLIYSLFILILLSCSKDNYMQYNSDDTNTLVLYEGNEFGIDLIDFKENFLISEFKSSKLNDLEQLDSTYINPFKYLSDTLSIEFIAYMNYCFSTDLEYIVCCLNKENGKLINITNNIYDKDKFQDISIEEFIYLIQEDKVDFKIIKNTTNQNNRIIYKTNLSNSGSKSTGGEYDLIIKEIFEIKEIAYGLSNFYATGRVISKLYLPGFTPPADYKPVIVGLSTYINPYIGSYSQEFADSFFDPTDETNLIGSFYCYCKGKLTIEAGAYGFTAGYVELIEHDFWVSAP